MPLTTQQLDNATRAFRQVEQAAKLGAASTHLVMHELEKLSPEELGATLDFIQQGSDSVNVTRLNDLFEHSSKKAAFHALVDAPAVQSALAARKAAPMVESDVDMTLLDAKQKGIPGMKAALDVLGDKGGSVHIISARVKALGLPTDIALHQARMQVNSTAFGTLKNFDEAGLAHLEDTIGKIADPKLKAKLVAQREGHYQQVGSGKFDIAQQRMANNPGRTMDFLGDDVEGDMYFFDKLLKDNDARGQRNQPQQVGLVCLHLVSGKPIPDRLATEAQQPNGKAILYKDAADLAAQLFSRGRITAEGRDAIVAGFKADGGV